MTAMGWKPLAGIPAEAILLVLLLLLGNSAVVTTLAETSGKYLTEDSWKKLSDGRISQNPQQEWEKIWRFIGWNSPWKNEEMPSERFQRYYFPFILTRLYWSAYGKIIHSPRANFRIFSFDFFYYQFVENLLYKMVIYLRNAFFWPKFRVFDRKYMTARHDRYICRPLTLLKIPYIRMNERVFFRKILSSANSDNFSKF